MYFENLNASVKVCEKTFGYAQSFAEFGINCTWPICALFIFTVCVICSICREYTVFSISDKLKRCWLASLHPYSIPTSNLDHLHPRPLTRHHPTNPRPHPTYDNGTQCTRACRHVLTDALLHYVDRLTYIGKADWSLSS